MTKGISRSDAFPDSVEEATNYQNASRISQEITDFASGDIPVTLDNPHTIQNATGTAGNIAFKLVGDSAFRTVHFEAGAEMVKQVADVGEGGTGTTVTKVIVYGV